MASISQVTDLNFDSEVLKSGKPVLVDFWAPWCGPCRMVAPVVEALAGEYGDKLKVVKLNVDENQNTASGYQIMSIPTLAVFKDGQVAKKIIGYMPKEELKKRLDPIL